MPRLPKNPKVTATYLTREYVEKKKTVRQIAQESGYSPNHIHRLLKHYGIKTRDHSESLSVAYEKGRIECPTKGKPRPAETKKKISKGRHNAWKNSSAEEKKLRISQSKKIWDNLPDEEKESRRKKAAQKLREATKEGSRLEKYIRQGLQNAGYPVEFHREDLIPNNKMQVDLFVPKLGLVIEIDGPSHYLPIWGEERLLSQQESDKMKNGLVTTGGFIMLRVKNIAKNTSRIKCENILERVLEVVRRIEKNRPKAEESVIYI